MALIVVIKGPKFNHKLRLDRPYVIGRSKKADLTIPDESCSGQHLQIQPDGNGGIVIEDLDSTNGSTLNDNVISQQCQLYVGDLVQIGETKIYIHKHSLSEGELKKLTSSANHTHFATINLPESEHDGLKRAREALNRKRGRPSEDDVEEEDELQDKEIVIDIDSGESKLVESDKPSSKVVDNTLKDEDRTQGNSVGIAKKVKGDSSLSSNYKGSEDDLEYGESSGQTSMIKIERVLSKDQKKKEEKRKASKKKKKKKKKKKEEPQSLLSKIIGIFFKFK